MTPTHDPHDAKDDPANAAPRSGSAPPNPAFASASTPAVASSHAGSAAHAGTAADGAPVVPKPPPLSPEVRTSLRSEFADVLRGGVHGLCFSAYLQGQSPGSQISAQQIRDRLEVIRPYARWIRTFSCTDGNELAPAIAKSMGIGTLVGAWLGTDGAINAREIAGAIAVAQAGHADIVAVGNEVLLRDDLSEDELIAAIEQVRKALPGVPVGYVDAYYLFEKHPRVTAACDVVMTNCYPFWEGCSREQAVAYMQTMVQRTRAAAPGKRVLISETGWPDQGSNFHGAVPSEEGAMRYFIDTVRWAREDGIELFYFAAFDEAWKVGAEGDVGAFWGLWNKDGEPKFG